MQLETTPTRVWFFCAFKNIGDFRALCQRAVVDNLISKSTLIDELFEMVMAVMSLPFFNSGKMSFVDEFSGYNCRDFDNHKRYVQFA